MKKHEHSGIGRKTFPNPKEILVKAGLEKGDFVFLDIGTGSGYFSEAASEIMGSGSKVYALDIHEDSIDMFNKKLSENGIKNVFAVKADASNEIPVERDSADICLMSNVVHGFVPNGEMDKVLRNLNAVLKDDGKLIIIDFNKLDTSFGPPLEMRLDIKEIEDILEPYGYELVNAFDVALTHYCAVFKKMCIQSKWC